MVSTLHFLIKNITYGKINIRVPLPQVFICEVWNYSKADVESIKKSIIDFNWKKGFIEKIDFKEISERTS